MSNELTIATESGKSIEELMGISTKASSGPSLARLSQLQTPIKGEVEMNGKKMRMDVLDVGTFVLRVDEDTTVYSNTVTARIFLQREQWTRWNSDSKAMEKTVLANDLKNDLHDNCGGFNIGRPSGYIQDWDAIPESTKDLIRSVKRTRVVMGLITLDNPVNEAGEPVSNAYTEVPFIYDVKNRESLKALDQGFKAVARKNVLPFAGQMKLEPVVGDLPNGNQYAYIKSSVTGTVDLTGSDQDTLQNFLDVVQYVNTGILDKYHENKDRSLDAEEAALVSSIVDVEVD